MNGARTIFRRKGYLLTALAAAVLLAASSGTAQAQNPGPVLSDIEIKLTAPRTVVESEDATVTVRATAMVAPTLKMEDGESGDIYNDGDTTGNRRITVYLTVNGGEMSASTTMGEFNVAGRVDDADIVSNPAVSLTFAENTGSQPRKRTVTGSITVRTNSDSDAENDRVEVVLNKATETGGVTTDGVVVPQLPSPVVFEAKDDPDAADQNIFLAGFTIDDDETQTYVLSLDGTMHTSQNPPKEGEAISLVIEAKPAHHQGEENIFFQLSKGGGRATGYAVADITGIGLTEGSKVPFTVSTPSDEDGDGNRVTDTITLKAYSGEAGNDNLEDSMDIDVLDIHMLPAADAITAVAKDEDGNEVTEIMEGGDPVFLTITVDRGRGVTDRITIEPLEVDIRAANAAQVADYSLSESRIELESRSTGKQTNDIDLEIELSARSDEDVGMEYLMLNLEVSGDSDFGTETSTGTFSIGIVDNTMKKVAPKAEADAYPAILDALKAGSGDDGDFNPGETFSVMASDIFDVADGYTASYGISVEGGSVSVSASSDSITVTGTAAGESKVTITATAKMAASSFLPEQTMSDVAKITFAVMVVEGMPEPVPALPLFGQLLLALFMTAGGARLYRRRQG